MPQTGIRAEITITTAAASVMSPRKRPLLPLWVHLSMLTAVR
jgi:hypothetical protein